MWKGSSRSAQKELCIIQRNEVAGQLSSLFGPPASLITLATIKGCREGYKAADSLFLGHLTGLEIVEQMAERRFEIDLIFGHDIFRYSSCCGGFPITIGCHPCPAQKNRGWVTRMGDSVINSRYSCAASVDQYSFARSQTCG